jgi:RNA polymerase sigma factor (sigma-70 family)
LRFLRSKNPSLLSDEELITNFRKSGNPAIIGVLFDRYSHLVYGVSYNYLKDEEDCKDAVLHIFENLGRDLNRYEIKNFSSWLHVVTKNHSLRQLSKRKDTVPLTYQPELIEEEESTPEFNIHLPNLSLAMDQLNDEQKTLY